MSKKKTAIESKKMFEKIYAKFDDLTDWSVESIKISLDECLKELEWKPRDFFMPLRIATTGRKDSPPLVDTVEVLGKDVVRYRLLSVIKKINELGS